MKSIVITALVLSIVAATSTVADVKPFDKTNLTNAQRAVIQNILNSDDNDNTKNRRIQAILRRR